MTKMFEVCMHAELVKLKINVYGKNYSLMQSRHVYSVKRRFESFKPLTKIQESLRDLSKLE